MYPFKKPSYRLIIPFAAIVLILAACGGGGTPTPDPCSVAWLVAEINAANASPAANTINLAPGCTYELDTIDNTNDGNNGLPSITTPITISGNGATIQRRVAIGTPQFRLLHVAGGGSLELVDVTLSNGEPGDDKLGGAIINNGSLTVTDSIISNSEAVYGGGIYNNGYHGATLQVSGTDFSYNRAVSGGHGGAIYNGDPSLAGVADATIVNSVFYQNQAYLGGAVSNGVSATMVITDSWFRQNTASRGGALSNENDLYVIRSAIFESSADSGAAFYSLDNLHIYNSTISSNSLTGSSSPVNQGSAINIISGRLILSHVTITNNSGGGRPALHFESAIQFGVQNSIIANNAGGDCNIPASVPSINPVNANLDSDGSCTGFTITADPLLGPLADNGGPSKTHALLVGSPAIDVALANYCLPEDQRGITRPQGSACDLGAYEYEGPIVGPIGIATPLPTVIPSSVTGFVFIDDNNNGIRDVVEETTGITGAHLTLMEGPCPGTVLLSETWSNTINNLYGLYSFGMLMPGSYCILTDPNQQTILPETQEITVGNDEHLEDVNFYHPNLYSTSPTNTPTPTSSIVPFASILKLSLCWVGPGDPYDVVSSLQPGTQVELLGTGEGGGYLVVQNPKYNLPCWVREADVDTGGFDVFTLPVIKIPPLPTKTPTPAPLGCWVSDGLAAGPRCVSPCPDPIKYPKTCTP